MLITLRYADELRGARGFELPAANLKSAGVTAKEQELAKRLVEDMAEHWNPAEFKDTYHEDLMRRIKEKIKRGETREITKPAPDEAGEHRSAQVIDLAALLKQSLDHGAPRRKAPARTREAGCGEGPPAPRGERAGYKPRAGETQARLTLRPAHAARALSRETRFPDDAGAAWTDRAPHRDGPSLRHPEACGEPLAL